MSWLEKQIKRVKECPKSNSTVGKHAALGHATQLEVDLW